MGNSLDKSWKKTRINLVISMHRKSSIESQQQGQQQQQQKQQQK